MVLLSVSRLIIYLKAVISSRNNLDCFQETKRYDLFDWGGDILMAGVEELFKLSEMCDLRLHLLHYRFDH